MTGGEIRLLDAAALRRVYRDHVKADFPPAERKPLAMIERQVRTGQYDTLGLFRGETLLAYAFLWRDKEGHCALLDYLAVCRGGRGQGTGSAFVEQLKAHFRPMLEEKEAKLSEQYGQPVHIAPESDKDFMKLAQQQLEALRKQYSDSLDQAKAQLERLI